MTYIKFISKSDEWFDEGTEVFDATICDWGRITKRMTVDNYNDVWLKAGHILGRGIRNGCTAFNPKKRGRRRQGS